MRISGQVDGTDQGATQGGWGDEGEDDGWNDKGWELRDTRKQEVQVTGGNGVTCHMRRTTYIATSSASGRLAGGARAHCFGW